MTNHSSGERMMKSGGLEAVKGNEYSEIPGFFFHLF